MLVGMHPDQATEPMIDFALRFGKPFACALACTSHFTRSDETAVLPGVG